MDTKPFALAVRLILFNEAGEVLLLQRSRSSKTNPGRWELPGGKIDPGEQFDAALRREMLEETGLVVSLTHVPGVLHQAVDEYGLLLAPLCVGGLFNPGGIAADKGDALFFRNLTVKRQFHSPHL